MAKSLKIERTSNSCKIYLDGFEVKDVCSYTVQDVPKKGVVLTLEIAIMDDALELTL